MVENVEKSLCLVNGMGGDCLCVTSVLCKGGLESFFRMIVILVMTDWSPYLQGFRGLRCVSDGVERVLILRIIRFFWNLSGWLIVQ